MNITSSYNKKPYYLRKLILDFLWNRPSGATVHEIALTLNLPLKKVWWTLSNLEEKGEVYRVSKVWKSTALKLHLSPSRISEEIKDQLERSLELDGTKVPKWAYEFAAAIRRGLSTEDAWKTTISGEIGRRMNDERKSDIRA